MKPLLRKAKDFDQRDETGDAELNLPCNYFKNANYFLKVS